jgi:hypothetical protein
VVAYLSERYTWQYAYLSEWCIRYALGSHSISSPSGTSSSPGRNVRTAAEAEAHAARHTTHTRAHERGASAADAGSAQRAVAAVRWRGRDARAEVNATAHSFATVTVCGCADAPTAAAAAPHSCTSSGCSTRDGSAPEVRGSTANRARNRRHRTDLLKRVVRTHKRILRQLGIER